MSNNIYCLHCNATITSKKHCAKFCSRSCAASFNNKLRSPRTKESKNKTASTIKKLLLDGKIIPRKGNYKEIKYIGPYTPIKRKICTNCSKLFWAANNKVTCSEQCRHERSAFNNVKKQHIAFFNPFDREIVLLHSNWEVIVANWLNDNNIEWSRPSVILHWVDKQNNKRRYTPDFFIKKIELYVDVKNPLKILQEQEKIHALTTAYSLLVGNIDECKNGIMAALL